MVSCMMDRMTRIIKKSVRANPRSGSNCVGKNVLEWRAEVWTRGTQKFCASRRDRFFLKHFARHPNKFRALQTPTTVSTTEPHDGPMLHHGRPRAIHSMHKSNAFFHMDA